MFVCLISTTDGKVSPVQLTEDGLIDYLRSKWSPSGIDIKLHLPGQYSTEPHELLLRVLVFSISGETAADLRIGGHNLSSLLTRLLSFPTRPTPGPTP